jgi:hypothetical protein
MRAASMIRRRSVAGTSMRSRKWRMPLIRRLPA